MGEKESCIKLEGVPDLVELRPDIGVEVENVAFCFKKVDEFTFKARVSPEVIAIMLGAVRIVRCKDCKHRDPEDLKCDCGGLERAGCILPVDDNYFCAHGERKEAEG